MMMLIFDTDVVLLDAACSEGEDNVDEGGDHRTTGRSKMHR